MNIRQPRVCAVYYYLGETPDDGPTRRREHHELFVADAHRIWQALAGWLALPTPPLPDIPLWDTAAPAAPRLLMDTGPLQGRTNSAGSLHAYALRNMRLLHVVATRQGEHDQSVWPMLDEALSITPTTPTWLHTTRYWCGVAPRPPEDLEQERLGPIRAPFGVLCLAADALPHVLVYPDARTEARADDFLRTLAAQLDWYTVQARYRMDRYADHASHAARSQQQALDRVAQSAQAWGAPGGPHHLGAVTAVHTALDTLESTYAAALDDLRETRATAAELGGLVDDYRLLLLGSGLWDAAPRVCEAQIARVAVLQAQVEADVQYVEHTLGRLDLALRTTQARLSVEHSARLQQLFYLIAALGLALIVVLIADSDPARIIARLLALIAAAAIAWGIWRYGPPRGPQRTDRSAG